MKTFFDTSVLISAFLELHEHHEPSLDAFLRATPQQACCAAHSLAEFYSVITRLPGPHRLSGDQAILFLQEIRQRFAIIAISGDDYFEALKIAAAAGTVGGAVYDFLLARCAVKAGAQILLTWNIRDFNRFDVRPLKKVMTP